MRSLLLAGFLIALGLLLQALGGPVPSDAPPMHPAVHAPQPAPSMPAWRG